MYWMSRIRGLALAGSLLGLLLALGCSDDPPPRRPDNPGVGGPSSRGGSGGGEGGSAGEGEGGGGAGGEGGSGGTGETSLKLFDVRPARGSILGGDSTIISGVGFLSSLPPGVRAGDVTEVTFNGNPSVGIRVIDDDTILAQTPPGAAGDVDVVVRNTVAEAVCQGCFRYQAPVVLFRPEPSEGPVEGGTEVVLKGENLRDSMVVLFGNRAALSVEALPDGSLLVVLPPSDTEGSVDIRVFDVDGEATLRKSFHYRGNLAIEDVDPPGGPLAGGNEVLLGGSGFGTAAEVRVDGRTVPSQLDAQGRLRFVAPAGSRPGAVEIEVRTSVGSSRADYAYFDPMETGLSLYTVSPAKGVTAGGGQVTLVGTGFTGAGWAAYFDEVPVSGFRIVSANFAQVTVPPSSLPGAVDVRVRTLDGSATLPSGYRYVPSIGLTSVSPGSGPVEGGTSVVLRGTGFPEGARVFIGALEATSVERIDVGTIRAITPRGSEGPVPVRVVDPTDPEVQATLPSGFVYEGPFSLARIDPVTGARAGGTRTVLRGTGFHEGMAVSFGAVGSDRVTIEDPFTAVVYTPRGEVGTVDVGALSRDAVPASILGAFTYFDPGTTAGGSSGGPLNGTLNITVLEDSSGARRGFPLEGALVILGADDSTPLQGLTDSRGQITFSSQVLVKAQTVTAALRGYQSTTVVNQKSENLTILLRSNTDPPGQCQDGIDNDGDGLIDGSDIDCMCSPANSPRPELCGCPMMPMEQNACCDGIDNDGDGLVDLDDPDCACSGNTTEGPLPQCGNCIDDDGDGLVDFDPPAGKSPDPGCAHENDNDERGAIVSGQVWGFKKPRPLTADEQELAFVRISAPSVYHTEPISFAGGQYTIFQDGGRYGFEFSSSRYMALYAVYGIHNTVTGQFEPLLMGIRRNINPVKGQVLSSIDIVLDMHLDRSIPITIANPPVFRGVPGASDVFAYMDLGLEGVIPLGSIRTTTDPSRATLRHMPTISGENTIFLTWSGIIPGTAPLTAAFRRQAGDLSGGVTIGPLLGLTRFLQPTGRFEGTVAWAQEAGPTPDVLTVTIEELTMTGRVLQWEMVLPGSETQVTVPETALQALRAKYPPGAELLLTLTGAREPRFAYEQWNYDNLSLPSYTSFTLDQMFIQL